MNVRVVSALVAFVGLAVIWPDWAAAQKRQKGGNGGQGNNAEEVEIEGQVKQVTPQGLVVDTADGTRYGIGVGRSSQVTLQGEASKAFLVAGTFLEVELELDHAYKPTKEAPALTVVNISAANPPGLFSKLVLGRDFTRDENARADFLARGKMLAPKDGMLVLQTGQKIVSTKMTPGYILSARFDNWALAAVGDAVKGTVEVRPQPNTGLTQATCKKLTIDAAKPIEPPKTKNDEPKPKAK